MAGVRSRGECARIAVAFAVLVLIGITAGAAGVLLPAQITDYGVDKATIGTIFFAFSTGYCLCAVATGALIHHLGVRGHLLVGMAAFAAAAALTALRPGFAALLLLQALLGFGGAALDTGLNAYLSTLDSSTMLLNYLHAFFGVGALVGPPIAVAMLARGLAWTAVFGVIGVAGVGLLLAIVVSFPAAVRSPTPAPRPRLAVALHRQVVWAASVFLCVYIGIEVSVGSWGFSFLTESRGHGVLTAGWAVSGFWLGLTLGRFLLNTLAERVGMDPAGLLAGCVLGTVASSLWLWLADSPTAATAGMFGLGLFLGPIFPTAIAIVPRLVPAELVATTIGVLIAFGIAGGAVFPWLVGAVAQRVGAWSLPPLTLGLAVVLVVFGWPLGRRVARDPGETDVSCTCRVRDAGSRRRSRRVCTHPPDTG